MNVYVKMTKQQFMTFEEVTALLHERDRRLTNLEKEVKELMEVMP